ncbi:hypothetical protein ABKN59_007706 [Abortiporus biennis]
MSSRRRPDRSATPRWRSLSSTTKPLPATSVSLIFAQPLQGSPLRSAVDNLPAVGIDDSASFMSEMSRKRERFDSSVSSVVASEGSLTGAKETSNKRSRSGSIANSSPLEARHDGVVIDLTDDVTMSTPAESQRTDDPPPSSQPLSDSPRDLISSEVPLAPTSELTPPVMPPSPAPVDTSKSNRKSSSWFSSLTRSKGNDRARSSLIPTESSVAERSHPETNLDVQTSENVNPDIIVKPPESAPNQAVVVEPASTPIPFPTAKAAPSAPPSTHSSPHRSSWFGSRIKPTEPQPSTQVPTEPLNAPGRTESSNSAKTVTENDPGLRSTVKADSNPSSSLPQDSVPQATPGFISANFTSISSVDSEVVHPQVDSKGATTAAEDTSPVLLHTDSGAEPGRKASVSSLNPTSSRFMIRIPLLGRPKVPLDEAVAVVQSQVSQESSSGGPIDSVPDSPAPAPLNSESSGIHAAEEGAQPSNPCESLTGEPSVPSEEAAVGNSAGTNNPGRDPQPSTWWDYIGWSGAGAPQNTTNTVGMHNDEAQEELTPSVQDQDTPVNPDIQVHSAADEVTQTPEPPPDTHMETIVPNPTAVPQTPSLFSAETGKSQSSAWYSPWSWYAAPSPTAPVNTGDQHPESASRTQTVNGSHSKTESEMVKEDALAREEASTPAPEVTDQQNATPDEHASSPQPVVSPNPIESTIAANRSGWASFFMSRALLVKSITDDQKERDENGMEVMNIEDEEDVNVPPAVGSPASPPPPIVSANGKEVEKKPPPPPVSPPKTPTSPNFRPEREPRKSNPPAPPLTNSESIKRETTKATARPPSPAPSKKSGYASPTQNKPSAPNLVLPTWSDTFHSPPRSNIPPAPQPPKSKLSKTLSYVSGVLFTKDGQTPHGSAKGKEREIEHQFLNFGKELPKAFEITGDTMDPRLLSGDYKVVILGVAGWSPGAVTRTIAGGLPSSSSKFVNMTYSALEKFEEDHGIRFKKITRIPLEGDGTISRKVSRVHTHLLGNKQWMEDLHEADIIFVATHSQGSIISIHLLDRLIQEGHILTPRNVDMLTSTAAAVAPGGPLRYLRTSSYIQPYIQYFENAAAKELFDFQDTETQLSKDYVKALRTVMDHGAKMVYVASLNDQVVPIYSGLFTAASHPRILRALYIDGDAYHSSDFLSNLLVLLIRIMNSGLSDSGLLAHLSEATAGTLSGVGHSTAYEELATYSLAVNYAFRVDDGADVRTDLSLEPFNAVNEQNDYEIPWSLRDLIADERVAHFFAKEFGQLKDAFDDWSPKTSILRDIKRKLQPIQRLSSIRGGSYSRL